MKILGIVEFHPLDGSDPGLFLLAQGPAGEFRTPITQEQAVSFLSQTQKAPPPSEDGGFEDFADAAGFGGEDDDEDEPLVVGGGGYSMGASEFDDGDL